jgi:hypothetical protein
MKVFKIETTNGVDYYCRNVKELKNIDMNEIDSINTLEMSKEHFDRIPEGSSTLRYFPRYYSDLLRCCKPAK